MMQTPLRTDNKKHSDLRSHWRGTQPFQFVLQFTLMKRMPRVTISCITVPKAPRYLVSAISEE